MSIIGMYSQAEFVTEYPLDFGGSVRGELVFTSAGYRGLIIAHQLESGEVCSTVVSFNIVDTHYRSDDATPLWRLLEKEGAPITVTGPVIQCVNCTISNKGSITDGKWVRA